MNLTEQFLIDEFGIDERVLKIVAEAEDEVRCEFEKLDDIMAYNQYKVLSAFQKNASVICTSAGRQAMATMTQEEKQLNRLSLMFSIQTQPL